MDDRLRLEQGAVFILSGVHQGRVGFYCLQHEQMFNIDEISSCKDCRASALHVEKLHSNVLNEEQLVTSPIEIEVGIYCPHHQEALEQNEMAVIYWDEPFGEIFSLVHRSELQSIPSTQFARYLQACKTNVDEALRELVQALQI